jgi:branched-chain amino acid transport system ATP-binding protein
LSKRIWGLTMSMLDVKDLHAGYGALGVLRGLNLRVEEGEVVALLGTNGAGKTTLLRTISGLHRPSSGQILYQGKQIQELAPHLIQASGLALVPEGRQLFPEHTVIENLELGAFVKLFAGGRKEFEVDLERIYTLFPRVKERVRQRAGLLSGGEQQMVAIARALISRPKLLLLDEPSLGLAPIIVTAIFDIFLKLRESGTTILLVEQMAHQALALCDRAYMLGGGRIQVEGTRAEMLTDERVIEAYLGQKSQTVINGVTSPAATRAIATVFTP